MKKITIIYAAVIALFIAIPIHNSVIADEEDCNPTLNLPTDVIKMTLQYNPPDWDSMFKIELSEIYGNYDVMNGIYLGWCVEYGTGSGPSSLERDVVLYSSYEPPEQYMDEDWHKLNYILNHKQGDRYAIQQAIRYFVNFGDWEWDKIWGPYTEVFPETLDMIDDANENADDWCPGCGDVIAVICHQIDLDYQIIIIEVPIPCYEGGTPGFWKNKGVKVGWPAPYTTSMELKDVFDIPGGSMTDNDKRPVYETDTLITALNYKGGEEISGMAQTLLRAAVAAILNAAHVEINYPLSVDDIKMQVNAALATNNRTEMETLKDQLDYYNNLKFDEWW